MSSQRFALIVGVFIPLVISGGISSLFQSNVGRINLFHHTFSPSELGEDFDVLRQGLEEGHPGLYRYTSKAEMDRAFDTTKLQLNRPMNEVELYRVLAPLVAHIKCGHTVLHPAPSDEVRGGELVFPFSMRVQSGRIFLYDDFATAHQTLAGAEVVSINDAPASRILSTMMADIGSDGSILTFKENWIGQGRGGGIFRALFSRMLTPTLGIRSPYVLKYRSVQTGEEKSLNIAGEPFDALVKVYETKYPMEARPPRLPDGRIAPKGMPEFFDGGSIAVWRFPGFGGYTDEDRRGSFVERAFQLIRDHGSAALILDTRNVGGGADFIGAKLFSYFADAPFRYYDDLIANRLSFKFFSHVYKKAKESPPLPAGG